MKTKLILLLAVVFGIVCLALADKAHNRQTPPTPVVKTFGNVTVVEFGYVSFTGVTDYDPLLKVIAQRGLKIDSTIQMFGTTMGFVCSRGAVIHP